MVLVPVKEATGELTCGNNFVPPYRKEVRGDGQRTQAVFLAGSAASDAGQGSFEVGLPALGGPGVPAVSGGAPH